MDVISQFLLVLIGIMIIYFLLGDKKDDKVIWLTLDKMYVDLKEMADAVVEQLAKEKTKCEIVSIGKMTPEFFINDRLYLLTYYTIPIYGVPLQVIKLKPYTQKNH